MPAAEPGPVVYYWDASAVISALLDDEHGAEARRRLRLAGTHLLSSLTHAESASVLRRLVRSGDLSARQSEQAVGALDSARWTVTEAAPERRLVRQISSRHRLFGADLWHLALAMTMSRELPGLELVTFDRELREAATAESLAA